MTVQAYSLNYHQYINGGAEGYPSAGADIDYAVRLANLEGLHLRRWNLDFGGMLASDLVTSTKLRLRENDGVLQYATARERSVMLAPQIGLGTQIVRFSFGAGAASLSESASYMRPQDSVPIHEQESSWTWALRSALVFQIPLARYSAQTQRQGVSVGGTIRPLLNVGVSAAKIGPDFLQTYFVLGLGVRTAFPAD